MSGIREELVIVFQADQTQIDNVLRSMPVKFAAASRRSSDALESGFKEMSSKLGGKLSEAFLGAFTGAALGTKIADMIIGGVRKGLEYAHFIEQRSMDVRRGVLRTDLDPLRFQQGENVFTKTVGEGTFERGLERVGDAVAKAREGGEGADKMSNALIELGATLDTINSGDYRAVFFQIAANMQSAAQSAEKIAALRDVFGKSGPELILGFRKGMDSLVANTGLVDETDIAHAAFKKKQSEKAGFVSDAFKRNWLFRMMANVGEAGNAFSSIFGEMFGIVPDSGPNRSADERALNEAKTEKEKEQLRAKIEAAKLEKEQKKQAEKDADLAKETARIEEENQERIHRISQKQLTLEEQIAEAKKLQAKYDKEAFDILNKRLETVTNQDKRDAAAASAKALKAQEEAAQLQKQLDARKKEFQAQADDAAKRLKKTEEDMSRTVAERYGLTIAQLAAPGMEGFDPAEGVRGGRRRKLARRQFNQWAANLSSAEFADMQAARDIEQLRSDAQLAAAYGHFMDAQEMNFRADEIAKTLNFAKPSESDPMRAQQEAISQSRDALQEIATRAKGEGIVVQPRMGE